MNPIPLRSPDGVLVAWACSHCGHVGAGIQIPVQRWPDVEKQAEYSKEYAQRCCLCSRCKERPRPSMFEDICEVCAPIATKEREDREKEWSAWQEKRNQAIEDSLKLAKDRESAITLQAVMSTISETYWCAGWESGLELSLWHIAMEQGERDFGQGRISDGEVARLKLLHERSGGWWRWDEEVGGTLFVPEERWLWYYAKA